MVRRGVCSSRQPFSSAVDDFVTCGTKLAERNAVVVVPRLSKAVDGWQMMAGYLGHPQPHPTAWHVSEGLLLIRDRLLK